MSIFAIEGILITSLCILMATLVYAHAPHLQINKVWAVFCLLVAVWGLISAIVGITDDYELSLKTWRALYPFIIFIPVVFYHFTLILLGRSRGVVLYFCYALTGIFLAFSWTNLFIQDVRWVFNDFYYIYPGPLFLLYFVFFVIVTTYSHYLMWLFIRKSPHDDKSRQLRWFFVASSVGHLGGLQTFLPTFGIDVYPIGNFGVALYPIIMGYAMIQHELMDMKVAFKKTLLYTIALAVISFVYIAVVVLINHVVVSDAVVSNTGVDRFRRFAPILPFLGTLSFGGLGIFMITHRPRTFEKALFATLCLETFFWQLIWLMSFFIYDQTQIHFLAKIVYLGIAPLPFTFYHFMSHYSRRGGGDPFVGIFYGVALFFLILLPTNLFVAGNQEFSWGNFSRPGPLYIVFVMIALLSMGKGIWMLVKDVSNSDNSTTRSNKSKYLLLAAMLYALCTLDFLQIYGAQWFPPGTIFFLLSFLVISYAIYRHEILDITIALKKTLFYTVVAICVSLFYMAVVYLIFTLVLRGSDPGAPFVANFIGILLIAMTFKPIELFVYRKLDRRFFKGTISEIAQQKERLETELERTQRLKSVGILAAGMAHEIKNPITAINTFAEYLPKKYDDPEFRKKFLRIVQGETARIKNIITDLLAFSRPQPPRRELCDISVIIENILELLSSDLIKRKIKTQTHFEVCSEVYVDSHQIKQALLNVLMNAMDAMTPSGGLLSVRCRQVGNNAIVEILDTGDGIAADRIPHIFDPFYSNKDHGTGLGLAITHSLLQSNEGSVQVASSVGKGTTFRIFLPIATPGT